MRLGSISPLSLDWRRIRCGAQPRLPLLEGLPANNIDIWHYCVTEMVNNAIDHSEGSRLTVVVNTRVQVLDDGIGIFRKIKAAFNLEDETQAILELSKGKLTTDPDRHSGQGIFFTSRMLEEWPDPLARDLLFTRGHTTPRLDSRLRMTLIPVQWLGWRWTTTRIERSRTCSTSTRPATITTSLKRSFLLRLARFGEEKLEGHARRPRRHSRGLNGFRSPSFSTSRVLR